MSEGPDEPGSRLRSRSLPILRALEPPLDVEAALAEVPELELSRGVEQSPYHHLDTFDHILEVVRRVERELEERETGAKVPPERLDGLRLAALLHDVAKPVTRGEYDGRVGFIAHDTLGAILVRRICSRLSVSALCADAAVTLTELHLKIGFMQSDRSDYPPDRLARAAGPFGEELAVLSWADRLAAQGPKLKDEQIRLHKTLCREFLDLSRAAGPHPAPDYESLREEASVDIPGSDLGCAASRLRFMEARGMGRREALLCVFEAL